MNINVTKTKFEHFCGMTYLCLIELSLNVQNEILKFHQEIPEYWVLSRILIGDL